MYLFIMDSIVGILDHYVSTYFGHFPTCSGLYSISFGHYYIFFFTLSISWTTNSFILRNVIFLLWWYFIIYLNVLVNFPRSSTSFWVAVAISLLSVNVHFSSSLHKSYPKAPRPKCDRACFRKVQALKGCHHQILGCHAQTWRGRILKACLL